MNRMYNAIVNFNKKVTRENAEDEKRKNPKRKYEYDSDEDTEGGTLEHKARMKEMQETKGQSEEVFWKKGGKEKHSVGTFRVPAMLSCNACILLLH